MDFQSLLDYGANLTFYLGIIFVIVAAVIYVRKRLSDLESKQNSMFDILGALAREVQSIKNGNGGILVSDNNMPMGGEQLDDYMRMETQYTDLIEESDDEDESDDNEGDEGHEGHEGDEGDEQEESDLTEEDDQDDEEEEDGEDDDEDDKEDDEDDKEDDDDDDEEDDDNDEGEKEEDNVKVLEVEELPTESDEPYPEAQEDGVKHVEITESEIIDSELNDINELSSETNYEKMTTKELKTLVSQKGLATEVGKMKRGALIKLLEKN